MRANLASPRHTIPHSLINQASHGINIVRRFGKAEAHMGGRVPPAACLYLVRANLHKAARMHGMDTLPERAMKRLSGLRKVGHNAFMIDRGRDPARLKDLGDGCPERDDVAMPGPVEADCPNVIAHEAEPPCALIEDCEGKITQQIARRGLPVFRPDAGNQIG